MAVVATFAIAVAIAWVVFVPAARDVGTALHDFGNALTKQLPVGEPLSPLITVTLHGDTIALLSRRIRKDPNVHEAQSAASEVDIWWGHWQTGANRDSVRHRPPWWSVLVRCSEQKQPVQFAIQDLGRDFGTDWANALFLLGDEAGFEPFEVKVPTTEHGSLLCSE